VPDNLYNDNRKIQTALANVAVNEFTKKMNNLSLNKTYDFALAVME
jgi:hypothetical protein